MANTYTEVFIHIVFAVKYRKAAIGEKVRVRLEKYITSVILNRGHLVFAIYCMPDHCHILACVKPHESLSDLLREIKKCSSAWLNDQHLCSTRFQWQSGYGAFSHSKDVLPAVINYIENQPTHHRETGFREEYIRILEEKGIEFDPKYVFHDAL